MPHFMIVLIFSKTFLDSKMFIFEEYGAFNYSSVFLNALFH